MALILLLAKSPVAFIKNIPSFSSDAFFAYHFYCFSNLLYQCHSCWPFLFMISFTFSFIIWVFIHSSFFSHSNLTHSSIPSFHFLFVWLSKSLYFFIFFACLLDTGFQLSSTFVIFVFLPSELSLLYFNLMILKPSSFFYCSLSIILFHHFIFDICYIPPRKILPSLYLAFLTVLPSLLAL